MGAPITRNLPVVLRQPGDHVAGPLTMPAGYTQAVATLNIPTADYEAPGNAVDVAFEWSDDGGNNWLPWGSIRWQSTGGPVNGRGGVIDPAPAVTLSVLPKMAGQQVRATLTLAQAMTVGAAVVLS